MAKFDVYARPDGAGFLLDCQADLLSDLSTRFVIPLMPLDEAPAPAARLNPVFELQGGQYVMATQFAAAILVRELGVPVGAYQRGSADRQRHRYAAERVLRTG